MNFKQIKKYLFVLTAILWVAVFFSCTVSKRVHRTGYYVNWNTKSGVDRNSNTQDNFQISFSEMDSSSLKQDSLFLSKAMRIDKSNQSSVQPFHSSQVVITKNFINSKKINRLDNNLIVGNKNKSNPKSSKLISSDEDEVVDLTKREIIIEFWVLTLFLGLSLLGLLIILNAPIYAWFAIVIVTLMLIALIFAYSFDFKTNPKLNISVAVMNVGTFSAILFLALLICLVFYAFIGFESLAVAGVLLFLFAFISAILWLVSFFKVTLYGLRKQKSEKMIN